MEKFKTFLEEREEEEYSQMLNEEPVTIALAILAVPTAVALVALGGTFVVSGYIKFMTSIINKIITAWKNIFSNVKTVGKKEVVQTVREIAKDDRVRRARKEIEQDKREYEEELGAVYKAIEDQNITNAKLEFTKLDKNFKNNPDIHKVLISEISKSFKEPPLYISSPGNKTYQAIKKIMNIRIARAAATATKMALEKELAKRNVKEMDEE